MGDEHYMREALDEAANAEARGEIPVGAIVVKDGKVIGRGFNHPISAQDPTAHAEVVAMRNAARAIGNYRLTGCELYVTFEPCVMCAGAIMHARLSRLAYGATDPKTGGCGSVVDLFGQKKLNHHTTVTGGILAEECGARLSAFFVDRRNSNKIL